MSNEEKKHLVEEAEKKQAEFKKELEEVRKSQAKYGVVREVAGGLVFNLSSNSSFQKENLYLKKSVL